MHVSNDYNDSFSSILVCVWNAFMLCSCGLASINLMAAIALDRLQATMQVLNGYHVAHNNTKVAWSMVLVSWAWAIGWSLPPIFGWNRFMLDGITTSCSYDYYATDSASKSYIISLNVAGFVVPLLVIIVCYFRLFSMLKTYEKGLGISATNRECHRRERTDVRIAKVCCLTVLCFVIAWLPYSVISILGVLGWTRFVNPLSTSVCAFMGKCSAMFNPILYAACAPRGLRLLRSGCGMLQERISIHKSSYAKSNL